MPTYCGPVVNFVRNVEVFSKPSRRRESDLVTYQLPLNEIVEILPTFVTTKGVVSNTRSGLISSAGETRYQAQR